MKLVTIDESQVVALLQVARPAGPLPSHTLIDAIQREFAFSEAPGAEARKDGLRFAGGVFEDTAIDSLSIHDDGIVLVSRSSTEFLDRVFAHLINVGQERYGFHLVKTHKVDRFYRSVLTIETDDEILGALKTIDPVRLSLESALFRDTGINAPYVPFGLTFASDPQKLVVKPTQFRIERKQGVDFDFHQYFCEAPLKTESHLGVLRELEALSR